MYRSRFSKVGAVLVVMLCLSIPGAMASSHGYGGKWDTQLMKKMHTLLKNEEKLGLSEEQVQQIKAIKIETKKALIQKQAEIDVVAVDIKAQMWNDEPDTEVLNALIDQKYELKKQKAKMAVNTCAKVRAVLSEEQRASMKAIMKAEGKKKEKACDKVYAVKK